METVLGGFLGTLVGGGLAVIVMWKLVLKPSLDKAFDDAFGKLRKGGRR